MNIGMLPAKALRFPALPLKVSEPESTALLAEIIALISATKPPELTPAGLQELPDSSPASPELVPCFGACPLPHGAIGTSFCTQGVLCQHCLCVGFLEWGPSPLRLWHCRREQGGSCYLRRC